HAFSVEGSHAPNKHRVQLVQNFARRRISQPGFKVFHLEEVGNGTGRQWVGMLGNSIQRDRSILQRVRQPSWNSSMILPTKFLPAERSLIVL
ncbi:hypothetical protein, partial [Rhizobium leguminosarum]|uniref:hypothetical protein n=1 Tax=Rhizobium leguminosarum TaxID=384 RepID=UPI003F94CA9C